MITQTNDAANRHYKAAGINSTRHIERVWIGRVCMAGMLSCIALALIIGG